MARIRTTVVCLQGERVELCFFVGVGADLQGDGKARVAEDDPRVKDGNPFEQRHNRVSHLMQSM